MCCGTSHFHSGLIESGVYYHGVGRDKGPDGQLICQNDILKEIWEHGAKERGETKPNIETFIKSEAELGLKHRQAPYPATGFENSLFYRKVQFSQVVKTQLTEQQAKDIKGLPIRRTDFGKSHCQIEMDFHLKWRREHSDKYPLRQVTLSTVGGSADRLRDEYHYWQIVNSENQIKMCAEYVEAVSNEPVHLSDLPIPPLDDWIRKKLR
jgi:hypothetical protein